VPEPKDTVAAILGASAALAGLLLVFVGFVYARAEGYSSRRGDIFKYVAKFGALPFLLALACTWLSAEWMTGSQWAFWWATQSFRWSLFLTAIYGAVTLVFFL
jgi:hypothetical protein